MKIQHNIPLSHFTTYRIGGPADLFVSPKNRAELIEALSYVRDHAIPYFILGTGANILVSDAGFRGLVIRNLYNHLSVSMLQPTETARVHWLRAGSGATIDRAIHVTRQHELSGLEHFAGIPSTVGGALWQNLHFLNPDRTETVYIGNLLHHAYVMNMKTGEMNYYRQEDFAFGYDTSVLHQKSAVVIDAVFQLQPLPFEVLMRRMRENITWREERHPPLATVPSCGSVFKKIQGIGAGRLIDECGLKGFRIGDAMVSPQHANFIINLGNATAADVIRVIRHVQHVVREEKGYALEPEISFVGDF